MNVQAMINNIKDNLGNRASGRIGSRDVNTVVLDAINLAVPHITLEAQPDYYNRIATLTLVPPVYDTADPPNLITPGQRVYALPVLDSEGNTIRIKDVYGYRCSRVGGTSTELKMINYAEFVKLVTNYDLELTGSPYYFALWGKENKMYFDYIPTEQFNMTMFVEVYPNQISALDLNLEMPIDDQWNLAVEAFATQHCYLKLQQLEMYQFWNDLYLKQKASLSRDESDKQSHNIDADRQSYVASEPALNPLFSRWNG